MDDGSWKDWSSPRWMAVVTVVLTLLFLARNTWPVQTVLVLFGITTGIDVQNLWDPPAHWNVKQTLTIETPHGDVTSSVVREKVMGADRLVKSAWSREKGEALTIEVTPARYLFVLIEEFKPYEEKLFFPDTGWDFYSAQKLHTVKNSPLEVPRERYPLMVTFGDLKDPKSVQEVDPFNLPATFGPGYKIKSYTVEITDESMTAGRITALLPTLADIGRQRCCLIPNDEWGADTVRNEISPSDFSTELYK